MTAATAQTFAHHAASCTILGVAVDASTADIRRAYKRLARRLHPDLHPGDTARAERFTRITAAYNDLTSPTRSCEPVGASRSSAKRRPGRRPTWRPDSAASAATHDDAWQAWRARWRDAADPVQPVQPETEAEARPWTPPPAEPRPEAPVDDAATRVSDLFGRVRDRVRSGWRAVAGAGALDGVDVSLRLPIDRDRLLRGGTPKIAVSRRVACPRCGQYPVPDAEIAACSICDGERRIEIRETLRVRLPAGARPGAKLRLPGKGTDGLDGRPAGDLYLVLDPVELVGFQRDGDNLHRELPVSDELRRHGGELRIQGPTGEVRVVVPAGTRRGNRFRLCGQGLPRWQGIGRGDLYLTVSAAAKGV